jgi:hypothetical protein
MGHTKLAMPSTTIWAKCTAEAARMSRSAPTGWHSWPFLSEARRSARETYHRLQAGAVDLPVDPPSRFDRTLVPYRNLRKGLTIPLLSPLPKEMSIVPT